MSTRRPFLSPAPRLLHAGLAVALMVAPGCKGGGTLPQAPQLPNSTGAALFSLEIQTRQKAVAIGQTLALQVLGRDDRDTPIDVTATWKSSDPGVANVSASGVVTGVKKGRATITATTKSPPREATVEIAVLGPGETAPPAAGGASGDFPGTTPRPGTGMATDPDGFGGLSPDEEPPLSGPSAPAGVDLVIYPSVPRVAPGEKIRLVALQGASGASATAAAIWRSADQSIATVDEAGVVTARKAGTVAISASSVAYPALTRQITLAVVAPAPVTAISGIRIKPSRVTMNVGETFWLTAEVPTWDGNFDPLVRWESGDPEVVVVDENGQLRAMGPGKTMVTAIATGYTRGDLSATVPVEVRNVAMGR